VLTGAKWNHNTVTWSLAQSGGQFSGNMGPEEEQSIQKALDQWSAVTGLTFKEVSPSTQSDIQFGWSDFDTADTDVVGFTTIGKKAGAINHAVVRLENPADDQLVNQNGIQIYAGTDASFDQTLLHEIGHALGFGDNVDPASIENFSLTQANRTLSSSDITAAASLYGKSAAKATVIAAVAHGSDGLIQAMSSFAPARMVAYTQAANDIDFPSRPVISTSVKHAAR
jgi:predicted Zn-dependent protease